MNGEKNINGIKEARFYKRLAKKVVQCQLCPHLCAIKEREVGICRARKNIDGKLISLSYGRPIAMHVDNIEKKPIYHALPGTMSYSIGTAGCSMRCFYCQNWEMSQASPEDFPTPYVEPEEIVKNAIKNKCKSIAYTYSEPVTMWEYVNDVAKLAKKKGLKNIIVGNGFINKEPLEEWCKVINIANIDLKAFNEEFYKKICGGRLKPVLESLKILKGEKIWLEITNLIIPWHNDSEKEIEKMCKWIKENLGSDVPLHFSRFFPMYKMQNIDITPEKTLLNAKKTAEKYLDYVYVGNVRTKEGENTYCPKCRRLLIKRSGFEVVKNEIKDNKCGCGYRISGAF